MALATGLERATSRRRRQRRLDVATVGRWRPTRCDASSSSPIARRRRSRRRRHGRHRQPAARARGAARREGRRDRQQGDARRRRPPRDAAGARARRRGRGDEPGRPDAPARSPGSARSIRSTRRSGSASPANAWRRVERLVLTASGGPFLDAPADACRRDPRAGARAPDLAHGRQDHDRLGDAREQGPGGHRSALAVRCRVRRDRRRHPPAEHRPLARRVRRRLAQGPARHPRHAHPHPVRPDLSRPPCPRRRRARPPRDRAGSTSARPTRRAFRRCASPARPAGPGPRATAALIAADEVAVDRFLDGHARLPGHRRGCCEAAVDAVRRTAPTRRPMSTSSRARRRGACGLRDRPGRERRADGASVQSRHHDRRSSS